MLFYLDIFVITPFKVRKSLTLGIALCKGKCTSLTAFKNIFENKQDWIEMGKKKIKGSSEARPCISLERPGQAKPLGLWHSLSA